MEVQQSAPVAPKGGIWLLGSADELRGEPIVWRIADQDSAIVWVSPATQSRFAEHARLRPEALRRSLALEAVWLSSDRQSVDLPPVLYRAPQRGRIWDCNTVVAHVRDADCPVARLLKLAELNAAPEPRDGALYMASAQMLDVSIHEAAQRCTREAWAQVQPELALEAVETVRHWVQGFYRGSWARSIFEKTMTREQYVQSLSNMHHYVRQTTQHLGRAVANAHDRELRRHFVDHLNGEINHEISIENDLRHLGADPEYVMHHRMPTPATKAFMALQETTIAFYNDPMLLMACPLVAEGITANMPSEFVTRLRELVVSWGVTRPERATSFLTSHAHTDGGDDGHWRATVAMLSGYLVDEATQRRFLCTLRAAADCMERSCNSNIEDLRLFAGVA